MPLPADNDPFLVERIKKFRGRISAVIAAGVTALVAAGLTDWSQLCP